MKTFREVFCHYSGGWHFFRRGRKRCPNCGAIVAEQQTHRVRESEISSPHPSCSCFILSRSP